MIAFRKSEFGVSKMNALKGEVRDHITCMAKVQSALLQGAWRTEHLRKLVRAAYYRSSIGLSGLMSMTEATQILQEILAEEGFGDSFKFNAANPFNL